MVGGVMLLIVLVALSGCATQQVTTGPGEAALPDLALKAPVGLPGDLTSRLIAQMRGQLRQRQILLADREDGLARYTLQGFCSVVPSKNDVGLACVWDVVNPSGGRAQRFVSDRSIPGRPPKDPWNAVTNTILDDVAKSTAQKVSTWLQTAPQEYSFLNPASSFFSGRTRVALVGVTGAPGDGNKALSSAFIAAMKAQGLQIATRAGAAYLVSARVKLSKAGKTQQDVAIDWTVRNKAGVSLGSVNQRNKILRGALDNTWGPVAQGAANAAVKGVVQLLPER